MALATYSGLKSAIASHMARDDLTSYLDDFVVLAEAQLNSGAKDPYELEPLRVREMEVVGSLTPTSGVCTLPSAFLDARRVVEKASTRRPLEYLTPEMADYYYPDRASGLSCHYTIIGSSLYTFPLSANDIEVVYYRTILPLASNDPNWLLTKSPNTYLRASLFQAALFVNDDANATKQSVLLRALVAGLNASDSRANNVNAGVYLRGPTP